MITERCFACDKPLRTPSSSPIVITSDGAQVVAVGPDCFRRVKAGGDNGYQPDKGGPRLFVIGIYERLHGVKIW